MVPRLLAMLLVGAVSQAQTNKERAQQLLAEGAAHYEAGRYQEALDKFQSAYRAFESPKLLLNIGAAYRKLDKPVDALDAYEQFLREAGPGIDAKLIERARGDVAGLLMQIGEIAFDAPPLTTVVVDGVGVGHTPLSPLRVPVGPHKVTLIRSGRESVEKTIDVRPGETAHVRAPAPGGAPPPVVLAEEQSAQPGDDGDRPWYARWPVWVGVGVVVGAVVIAAVAGRGGGETTERLPEADLPPIDTR